MRRTARALSVAVLAGAALVMTGPAASADSGAVESPGPVRSEAPLTVPGPVTVPAPCVGGTGAGAVPGGVCPSVDGRQTPAPQQEFGQTLVPGEADPDGEALGEDQGLADQQQGLSTADGLWQGQEQGDGQVEGEGQGQSQGQGQGQSQGQGQGQGCDKAEACEDGGSDGCRASGGNDDCPPAQVEHGVQAGQGGAFGDSVPALVAGGVLIAAACAGAGYRLLGRRRTAGG
ncbi:hypothetical protein [Streptomyces sp. NPDC003720]|uniref:hypothetical protein n=1 Tax=Streptomyces sp. NPDC003720 TaxID=3364684 RepID=UPI003686AF09